MCNDDIDTDLIFSFLDVRVRACVRVCVCGAGPVSSVVLHIEKKVKERESECIKYKCVYIRIQTHRGRERERENESSKKKCIKSRLAFSMCTLFFPLLQFYFTLLSLLSVRPLLWTLPVRSFVHPFIHSFTCIVSAYPFLRHRYYFFHSAHFQNDPFVSTTTTTKSLK